MCIIRPELWIAEETFTRVNKTRTSRYGLRELMSRWANSTENWEWGGGGWMVINIITTTHK